MVDVMSRAFSTALDNIQAQSNREEHIPVPKFNGEGDVELFVRQFKDIMCVSKWSDVMCVLKLRHALQGKAQPCGQGNSTAEIFANLSLCFGLSGSEARSSIKFSNEL